MYGACTFSMAEIAGYALTDLSISEVRVHAGLYLNILDAD